MIEICNPDQCTGCELCRQVCNKDAISFSFNDEGFWHPVINQTLCVDCGICSRRCPANIQPPISARDDTRQQFYVAWNNDRKTRLKSSSGGVVAVFEEEILKDKGIVFGVRFDRTCGAIFDCCDNLEDTSRFRGSKYVQARVGDAYKKVAEHLKNNKKVLFCGTPCQVAALRSFLKENNDNLFCIDFICHGTPSPGIFLRYLSEIESDNNCVTDYIFRAKHLGWDSFSNNIIFSSNKIISTFAFKNQYMSGFLSDSILNKSCHACHYTTLNRTGDITVSDFWDYIPSLRHPLYWRGVSQIIVNSNKGEAWLNHVKDKLFLKEISILKASQINNSLKEPFPEPSSRHHVFKDYKNGESVCELSKKYFPISQESDRNIIRRTYIRRFKNYIPQTLKDFAKGKLHSIKHKI